MTRRSWTLSGGAGEHIVLTAEPELYAPSSTDRMDALDVRSLLDGWLASRAMTQELAEIFATPSHAAAIPTTWTRHELERVVGGFIVDAVEGVQAMIPRLGSVVAVLACALLPGCAPHDCSSATSSSNPAGSHLANSNTTGEKTVPKELIQAIATGDIYNMSIRGAIIDVPSLVATFAGRPVEERVNLVHFLRSHLGRTNDIRADMMAGLVQLCGDPDYKVYTVAVSVVVSDVPDDFARDHAAALMRVVEAHPEDSTSAWLAAKLGSARARRMVAERRVAPGMWAVERDIVLGKLGDTEAEMASLARYHQAMDPQGDLLEAERWTQYMRRMGTAAAVIALARDLRHPGVYIWGHGSERMVRADVVTALAGIFPREPVLQQELTSNEHYARIEAWAERKFGVTWSTPSPPYVHEAPSPTYPRP